MQLTTDQLESMGFTETPKPSQIENRSITKDRPSQTPREGALLICYHKLYGLTIGYFTGEYFILPFQAKKGYSWATHWMYHN